MFQVLILRCFSRSSFAKVFKMSVTRNRVSLGCLGDILSSLFLYLWVVSRISLGDAMDDFWVDTLVFDNCLMGVFRVYRKC